MTRWFLPKHEDLLGALRHLAALADGSGSALEQWARGDAEGARLVREIEHEADDAKRQLFRMLRRSFSPPIDGEDLFVLAEGFETIINQIKNVVREAEVLELPPDPGVAEMAAALQDGIATLGTAVGHLTADDDAATAAADRVIKCNHDMEHIYRRVMSASIITGDLHEVMGKRELYRRLARLGEATSQVAERVWYAVIKEG